MADVRILVRLAEIREFAELKVYFDEQCEEDIQRLARKTFAHPEDHEQIEWERKKAFYAGVDAVLSLPAKVRESQRKESQ